jgi:predicted ATPase with chaperone activity
MHLTARGYHRVLRVAPTVSDLDGREAHLRTNLLSNSAVAWCAHR